MKTTLVTGASGRTGRKIIEKLQASGHRIRAFVRREEAARQLAAMGVAESFLGNLEVNDDLYEAVKGVQQIIHICPPMHPQEDRIGISLIEAAAREKVELFVEYSVLHPVIEVPHHRRKLLVEAALIDSGLPYVIVQPARYMQHLNVIWPEVMRDGRHVMPFSTRSRFNLVDLDDLAEAVQRVCSDPAHLYATYQLAGPESLSMEDCARRLSELLHKPVVAVERGEAEFIESAVAAGFPPIRIETMKTMNRHYSAHGLVGNGNTLRWVLGREPTRYEDFVARELLR